MRLGIKYALAFIIGSFVSLLFVSLLAYALTRNALQKTIIAQQEEISKQASDTVDRFINQQFFSVVAKAKNDTLITFVKSKTQISSTEDNTLQDRVQATLQTMSPIAGAWDKVVIYDIQGHVLFSQFSQETNPEISKGEVATVFLKAKSGKDAYSDVIKDASNKETILFASPIIDPASSGHRVIGVLLAHASWQSILSVVHSISVYGIQVYNKNGLLIGDNQQRPVGSFLVPSSFSSQVKQGKNPLTDLTTSKEFITMVKEHGYGLYKGNNWTIIIQTPVQSALKLAVSAGAVIAGLLLPVIAVVNALLLYFVLELLRPLLLIGETAEEIAQGNLTKRVPYTGKDEIGKLADSFNKMASGLQGLYEELEKKVQEKTKELSQKMEDAETMNSFMIKRELKLIELKKRVAQLEQQLSERKT